MTIRVARFRDTVYLQSTEQQDWLIVLQRLDAGTCLVSCTDYATYYSGCIESDVDWIFADTRPIDQVKVLCIGAKLRIEIGDMPPLNLEAASQPSALRSLLQALTSNMFSARKGAEKATRLQDQLSEIREQESSDLKMNKDFGEDGKHEQKKKGQSLINPRVRKSRSSGKSFVDDL